MTRSNPRAVVMFAALTTLTSLTMAQTTPSTRPATGDVPVTHVALFSSGVGYFEHDGTVAGEAETILHFKSHQINDVLKSLVLQDLDGGQISSVSYPSMDPLGKLLKGFAVDLSGNPTVADLLGQLRGAEVLVTTSGNSFAGKILGVEMRSRPVGESLLVQPVLNVITTTGIKSVLLEEATSIQLADARLQDELNKALLAVAGARDADKKDVTLRFKGDGNRRVKVGYVVETPVWKTSYRLVIDEKTAHLQGWAIVENQTDTDWTDIQLSLVSGRPLSFAMNLYEPMYLPRPEAHLELFAGLTPQTYAEAREEVKMELGKQIAPASAAAPIAGRRRAVEDRAAGTLARVAADNLMDATSSISTQATAGQIGELFEYSLSGITLERQSSAMVPIVTEPIEVSKVSIYNRAVLSRHPLSGAKVKNTTGKHLLQGPITVFQAGSYAGDAQITNVPPGQERLISFGIDLQTLIDSDKTEQRDEIQSVKLVKGVLEVMNKSVSTQTFQMQNKSEAARTIVIEQPKMGGWDLVEDVKPTEKTDALYRFERTLEAGKSDELKVSQQRMNYQRIGLVETNVDQLVWYVRHGKTSDAVKAALQKAIDLRQQQVELERQIADANAQVDAISQEQTRMRENMKTVDRNTPYYARLMKKLDEQESSIEGFQAKVKELTAARDQKRGELEAYLKDLNVG